MQCIFNKYKLRQYGYLFLYSSCIYSFVIKILYTFKYCKGKPKGKIVYYTLSKHRKTHSNINIFSSKTNHKRNTDFTLSNTTEIENVIIIEAHKYFFFFSLPYLPFICPLSFDKRIMSFRPSLYILTSGDIITVIKVMDRLNGKTLHKYVSLLISAMSVKLATTWGK